MRALAPGAADSHRLVCWVLSMHSRSAASWVTVLSYRVPGGPMSCPSHSLTNQESQIPFPPSSRSCFSVRSFLIPHTCHSLIL